MATFSVTLPSLPADSTAKTRVVKVGWNQESVSQEVDASKKSAVVEVPDGVEFAVICGDVRQSFSPDGKAINGNAGVITATASKGGKADVKPAEGATSGK